MKCPNSHQLNRPSFKSSPHFSYCSFSRNWLILSEFTSTTSNFKKLWTGFKIEMDGPCAFRSTFFDVSLCIKNLLISIFPYLNMVNKLQIHIANVTFFIWITQYLVFPFVELANGFKYKGTNTFKVCMSMHYAGIL